MSSNEDLIEQAKEAINAVFGDSSVSQSETIDALQDIIGHAQVLSDAVYADMQKAESDDLTQGSGKIKVDDYSIMRWRLKDCPVCERKQIWDQHRFYTKGRSLLLDLLRSQGILNKEVL